MDNGKKRPILMVRTLQGWKKTDPESMFVFYLKSLIRLVEEKTGEKVMGIFVKLADFDEKANGWIHGSDTMKRVEKSLGVEVVVNAINNSDDKFLEVSEGGVELVKVL
uniref:Uncharacterized protein n=1 Tax=Panagrolaimus sp. JU765 TaxID=591449 RepID=A0AC34R3M6_9BILA